MTTLQDVRFAFRMMRRAPAFTAVALMLLALGIGANAAVFAAVNAVLLRSLPYQDAERLVFVRENGPSEISRGMRAGIPDYHDWRTGSQSFSDLAAYASTGFNVVRGDGAERVQAQVVSSNFARTLGVQPALGRFFTDEESRPGNARVVVVSHAFWQRALGSRREALGETLALDARAYTIVGVMPEEFVAPEAADVWIPLGFFTGPMLEWRANHVLEIVGRLRPGTSVGQAQRELNTVAARIWEADRLMSAGWTLELTPLNDVMLGPTRPALLTMLAAVTVVMLIACANVASLLLARAASRRKEIAVRVALGASLGRIARQLLTESAVLAVTGGLLGVVVAYAATGAIDRAAASHLGHFVSLRLDVTVLAYVAAIAVTTALLVSVAPLLQLRTHRIGVARTRGGTTDPGRHILTPLVAGEVAASVTLLVLAVLLVSSFDRLLGTDPGFSTDRTLSFRLTLPPATYRGPAERLSMYERVRTRLAALPGVTAVGVTSSLPFSRPGERRSNSLFVQSRHGDATGVLRTDLDPNAVPKADVRYVDAGFFTAMGLRLSRGALLDPTADVSSAPQAVINRTTVTRVFGGSDPIGQRIAVGSDPGTWRTVVGVVEDVTNRGLRGAPVEEVYLSHQHFPHASMAVLVRTNGDAGAMARVVSRELAALAPDVPVYDVRTMQERLVDSVGVQRLAALGMRALALVAFVLAVSGLYGVLAYLVSRRTHELGVRMALGATSGDVVAMVMRQAMFVVAPGIAVGLAGAVGAAQLVRGQLYRVAVIEPAVLAGVAGVVLAASAMAVLLPARAGSRVDPTVALRSD